MSDEKKNPAKEAEKPKGQEAREEARPRPVAKEAKAHHPKISKMSLAEVSQAIENTQAKMGGLHSRYALSLLERRAFLTKYGADAQRKAA